MIKSTPLYDQSSRLLLLVIFLSLFVLACKKKRIEPQGDELPKLGTCQPVTLQGGLSSSQEGYYHYRSSGGIDIKIAREASSRSLTLILTFEAFPNHFLSYELWGGEDGVEYAAMHENLMGKHLKDRIGNSRSLIFPDGTKITLAATGPKASVTAISIYDGAIAHHINISCNKVEYSSSNAYIAQRLDELQPDGEASKFELSGNFYMVYNAYTEDSPDNKVTKRLDLGSIQKDQPKQVNDLYDDPRYDHT